jgi:anaphase-promoting complex subunit 2
MRFWQAQRVIREVKQDYYEQFDSIEDWERADKASFKTFPALAYFDDDEAECERTSETGKTKMDTFWSYIVGMLTNIKALPLDRIHSMLKMFAMQEDSAYEFTIEELRDYLQAKVCNQELMFAGNLFRLPPTQ